MTSYYGRFGEQKPRKVYNNLNQKEQNIFQSKMIRQDQSLFQSRAKSHKLNQSSFGKFFNKYEHQNQSNILSNSHLINRETEKYKFLKYDNDGNTSLVSEPQSLQQQFSYKKVQLSIQQQLLGSNIDWKKDISKLASITGIKNIVLKPLRKLYEKNFRPLFFKFIQQTKDITFSYYDKNIPPCLYQLNHLSRSHVMSLYLTQNYTQNGIYQIVINQNGRFRLIKVNDFVPVDSQTNQHIWGIQQPWKMILVKVWACINYGYCSIFQHYEPFGFLQTFSSNNWKYYNLQRQKDNFFKLFKEKLDISYIVLQTFPSQDVQKMGLIPYNVGYNIIDITQTPGRYPYIIEVKCRFKHRWQGRKNLKNLKDHFKHNQQRSFRLQKNFLLTQQEFFNTFGCAYITSLSKNVTHVVNFLKIKIPKNQQNTIYLRFTIKNPGFMDFSFIQSHQNKITITNKNSIIDHSKYRRQFGKVSQNRQRYLRCKYMLIKRVNSQQLINRQGSSSSVNLQQSHILQSCNYQAYEFEYSKGYNKGDAHYLKMEPGTYYIRIKPQKSYQDSLYYFNYSCSQILEVVQQRMSQDQKQDIMQNCMISLIPFARRYKTKNSKIYCGNTFQSIGYGYIIITNLYKPQKQQREILIQVNLSTLWDEGYELLGAKKRSLQDKVALSIRPQKYLVLIFKKIDQMEQRQKYYWPPLSMNIFKSAQLDEENSPFDKTK